MQAARRPGRNAGSKQRKGALLVPPKRRPPPGSDACALARAEGVHVMCMSRPMVIRSIYYAYRGSSWRCQFVSQRPAGSGKLCQRQGEGAQGRSCSCRRPQHTPLALSPGQVSVCTASPAQLYGWQAITSRQAMCAALPGRLEEAQQAMRRRIGPTPSTQDASPPCSPALAFDQTAHTDEFKRHREARAGEHATD